MLIWIVTVNESRPNYVSYHFIFFLKISLDGWNISFDKQSKVFILFCYFFVILLTGSNDRFSEKIQTLEMYYHHFTWLLYLVICHFGKNCSKRLKISEMTIYSSHLYFWIFIWSTILTCLKDWIFTVAMWSGVKPSLFLGFTLWKKSPWQRWTDTTSFGYLTF